MPNAGLLVGRLSRPASAAAVVAAVLACVLLLAHGWVALASGYYANHVTGVWLALGRDLRDGIFYRPLTGSGEYGGTRYFPLLFALIASLMRAGFEPLTAGYAASLAGAALLGTGAYRFLKQMGLPRSPAMVGAMLALGPYFVQQSIFAVRVEPLAAGLALLGAAEIGARLRDVARGRWLLSAAGWFTLAVAAKPLAIYAPAASIIALLCARRAADAGRLAAWCTALLTLLLLSVAVLSQGRAIESFRATALAGGTPFDFLRPSTITGPLALLTGSRLLMTVFGLVTAALVAWPHQWRQLPSLLVFAAGVAAAIALGTMGTIITNQSIEPYVAAVVFLVWTVHMRPRLQPLGNFALAFLLIWMAAQVAREVRTLVDAGVMHTVPAERAAIVARVEQCSGPVLSESPLLPLLAGTRPVVLDPFALRAVTVQQPDVAADIAYRLGRHEFECVVLEHDPASDRGAAWYRNVHFGPTIIGSVLREYHYRESIGHYRIYTPRR